MAEDFHVAVTFDPKPIPGDWNGENDLMMMDTSDVGVFLQVREHMPTFRLLPCVNLED